MKPLLTIARVGVKNSTLHFIVTDPALFATRKLIPTELKKAWLKALRSGRYPQGRKRLHTNNNTYCCLGVACEILNYPRTLDEDDTHYTTKTGHIIRTALDTDNPLGISYIGEFPSGISCENSRGNQFHISLVTLNDIGYSFHSIARVIDALF